MTHWSCSKLADFIRGTKKPLGGTVSEWNRWEEMAKQKSRLRYWLAEDGLDFVQNLLGSPLNIIRQLANHLNNRYILVTHGLVASKESLKRGQWHDLSHRFLPCMFSALVDFVEMECAHVSYLWSENKIEAPWWYRWRIYKGWRNKELGLEYLRWSASLVNDETMGYYSNDPLYQAPTRQALEAKEILELYLWWTKIRPLREDPYELSDYNAISDLLVEKYGAMNWRKRTDLEDKIISHSSDRLDQLEAIYEAEDEAMMIRLIKIRNYLWT